jgi:hypothetical protein
MSCPIESTETRRNLFILAVKFIELGRLILEEYVKEVRVEMYRRR